MKKIEFDVLNAGMADSINILSDEALENVLGGAVYCGKGYSLADNGAVSCGCKYTSDGPVPITPAS